MTNEETIKTIEVAIAEVEWNYPMDYSIAFETAIVLTEENFIDLYGRIKRRCETQGIIPIYNERG